MAAGWTRREVLEVLAVLGLGPWACGPAQTVAPGTPTRPKPQYPEEIAPARYTSNLRALLDVLLPAERDEAGQVIRPGAVEVGAEQTLGIANFVVLAETQGLVPPLTDQWLEDRVGFDLALQRFVDVDLDVLATQQRPLVPFRELPPELMAAAVEEGFQDPGLRPVLLFVRAACFLAYLGAETSDLGLQAVGFPPFEDFAAGIAVSQYPRTLPSGEVDDYTYNQAPFATVGDDLSGVLDANGDLT